MTVRAIVDSRLLRITGLLIQTVGRWAIRGNDNPAPASTMCVLSQCCVTCVQPSYENSDEYMGHSETNGRSHWLGVRVNEQNCADCADNTGQFSTERYCTVCHSDYRPPLTGEFSHFSHKSLYRALTSLLTSTLVRYTTSPPANRASSSFRLSRVQRYFL